jgi:hypothetical protein
MKSQPCQRTQYRSSRHIPSPPLRRAAFSSSNRKALKVSPPHRRSIPHSFDFGCVTDNRIPLHSPTTAANVTSLVSNHLISRCLLLSHTANITSSPAIHAKHFQISTETQRALSQIVHLPLYPSPSRLLVHSNFPRFAHLGLGFASPSSQAIR